MNKWIKYTFLTALVVGFTACEPNDGEEVYVEMGNSDGPNKSYVFSYWASDYAQYIWQVKSLEDLMTGEINMKGYGIEQDGNMIPVGNRFFACSTSEDAGRSYYMGVNGELATGGREDRIFVDTQYAYGVTEDNKAIIVGASWEGTTTGNEILRYDPETVSYIGRKVHEFGMKLEGKPFTQWPTAVAQTGDYVYISYYPKPFQQGWDIAATDTAYVKVLRYPSLDYVTDIKSARTAPVGMYYANTALVPTENGDVYSISSNAYAAGFVPSKKHHSAIMRIKKNETSFDPDYFFDAETSILKGKLMAAYPAGNSKAVLIYLPTELDTPDNNYAFLGNNAIFKLAIIDLPTQEVTLVTNIKDVGGDNFYGYASLYAENGKAYKSFFTGDDARIYEIDLATGLARAGAKIQGGLAIPVISKLNY